MDKEKKDCSTCNGSGVITKHYIVRDYVHENDCEDCNGSGIEQKEDE